jgi:hypothetical protein
MKIIKLTETQLSNMIKNSLNKSLKKPKSFQNLNENRIMEDNHYNPDKLYDMEYIISILKKAPRDLKPLLNKLDNIPYENSNGEIRIYTKIPAVLHAYMWNR